MFCFILTILPAAKSPQAVIQSDLLGHLKLWSCQNSSARKSWEEELLRLEALWQSEGKRGKDGVRHRRQNQSRQQKIHVFIWLRRTPKSKAYWIGSKVHLVHHSVSRNDRQVAFRKLSKSGKFPSCLPSHLVFWTRRLRLVILDRGGQQTSMNCYPISQKLHIRLWMVRTMLCVNESHKINCTLTSKLESHGS